MLQKKVCSPAFPPRRERRGRKWGATSSTRASRPRPKACLAPKEAWGKAAWAAGRTGSRRRTRRPTARRRAWRPARGAAQRGRPSRERPLHDAAHAERDPHQGEPPRRLQIVVSAQPLGSETMLGGLPHGRGSQMQGSSPNGSALAVGGASARTTRLAKRTRVRVLMRVPRRPHCGWTFRVRSTLAATLPNGSRASRDDACPECSGRCPTRFRNGWPAQPISAPSRLAAA